MSTTAGAFVTDSNARYDPFGTMMTASATNPAISNHGFTGHRHNNTGTNNLGLIYMNARYYLPEVGRFISPDTIVPEPGNPQSFNRYAYVRNNPMNFTDPTGHMDDAGSQYGGGSLEDELNSPQQNDNRPNGNLQTVSQPVSGCDPVFQSCETNWYITNEQIRTSCSTGNCMGGHLWVYFGIPSTSDQRNQLLKQERRELCYVHGDCAKQEVGLFLIPLTVPIRGADKVITAIDILLSRNQEEVVQQAVFGASESGLELTGLGMAAKVVSLIGNMAGIVDYTNEMNSWNDPALNNINQRIETQTLWLEYYWQNGSQIGP